MGTTGSAALYDTLGAGYAARRRADPRIAARVASALGDATTVVNVGAGAGSYEPDDRRVVAVEPSARMVRQRPAGSGPAVRAVAEALPLRDRAVDAAMAVLTLHHWTDWRAGVAEMRRVARGRVAVLTWDAAHPPFWLLRDYVPQIGEMDRGRFPPVAALREAMGEGTTVEVVPVPADCTDGFLGAYWRRPERYLDDGARAAMSGFAQLDPAIVDAAVARLSADLADRTWHARNAALLDADEWDLGYRLLVGDGG